MVTGNSRSSKGAARTPRAQPAPIEASGLDTPKAGEFSTRVPNCLWEIGDELWNVRALVNALHDSLDWDERNSERRILRMIDERIAAIHRAM